MATQAELQLIIQALDQASAKIQRIGGGLDTLNNKTMRATRGTDAFNRASTRTAAALGLLSPTAATATSQLTALTTVSGGAAVALGAGALAAIGIGVALKTSAGAAIDFESSFARIRKTMEATEPEFAQLERANRKMAISFGASVNDINKIGEIAGALGITGVKNVEMFEKAILQIGTATTVSVEEAATAYGAFRNILQIPISEAGRFADALVDLGNKGNSTEQQILTLGLRIAAGGKIFGLATGQILGVASALAGVVGTDIEAAGTAVVTTFQAITAAAIEGGPHLETFAALTQMTTEAFAELALKDPGAAFVAFLEGLAASGQQAGPVLDALGIGGERLTRVMTSAALAGSEVARQMDIGTEAYKGNGAAAEEVEKQMDTTAKQIDIAKAKFRDLGISIGKVLLPTVVLLAQGAGHLADALGRIPAPAELTKLALVGVGGALVGLIFGVDALKVKWDKIFQELPTPVQEAAIAIAEVFDGLVGGIFDAIDAIVSGIASLGGEIGGVISKIPGASKIPGVSQAKDLAEALAAVGLNLEAPDISRQLRLLAPIHRRGGAGDLSEVFDQPGPTLPELDIGDFLDGLGESAGKAKAEVDILADGIIDLTEALEHGIDTTTAARLELERESFEVAGRAFRATVERIKADVRLADTFRQGELAAIGASEAQTEAKNRLVELNVELGRFFLITSSSASGLLDLAIAMQEIRLETAQATRAARVQAAALGALSGDAGFRIASVMQRLAERSQRSAEELRNLEAELGELFALLSGSASVLAEGQQIILRSEVEFARATFQAKSEIVALQVVLGQRGLAGQAAIFRHAMVNLGEGFRRAGESVTAFLQRLAQAGLEAAQSALGRILGAPTREQLQLELQLAELQRQRSLILQGGGTEEELASLLDPIDREIEAIQRTLDLRREEIRILQLRAQLADATILTDQELLQQSQLLIGLIAIQSGETRRLNNQLALEQLQIIGVRDALNLFADALRRAAGITQGLTSFQHGGIGDFGRGTMAMLHGREAVLPLDDSRRAQRIIAGLIGGAGQVAPNFTTDIDVNVNLTPELAQLRESVMRTVQRELDAQLRKAGFGGSYVGTGTFVPG